MGSWPIVDKRQKTLISYLEMMIEFNVFMSPLWGLGFILCSDTINISPLWGF
jgi:hypothetical protein